jgi:glycosyltransferase involved in cell wall biosynthesis
MRIAQVVPLATSSGAFGGPLRVALNQVSELRRRGHDVTIYAGWDGSNEVPEEVDGVPVRLFPVTRVVPLAGFSGLVSFSLIRELWQQLARYDVVHLHTGRHLLTLPAIAGANLRRVPIVTQTHGMVAPDRRPSARVFDWLIVRPLFRRAHCHLVLTAREEQDLAAVLRRGDRIRRLINGVPLQLEASTGRSSDEVLYCARLQSRKRPEAFVEMASLLHERGVAARFAMVGPDEGRLDAVKHLVAERGLREVVKYEGALRYDQVLGRLRRAAVYVLPSVDEPFPMSLLEALSLGVPSVCTDTCGIAELVAQYRAAVVTDGSPEQLADAVQHLLDDDDARVALSRRARKVVREVFSIEAVVDELEAIYTAVIGERLRNHEGRSLETSGRVAAGASHER